MLRFILLIAFFSFHATCQSSDKKESLWQAELLPKNGLVPAIQVQDLNCWVEQGQFFITGLCSNESAQWLQLWLKAEPTDKNGAPIKMKGYSALVVPTFSAGVAPKGRTAFFAGWPVADFSGEPVSCRVSGASAVQVNPGPILLMEQVGGVRMLAPLQEGETAQKEIAWQIQAQINNAGPTEAEHPRLELLLYGTDGKLWFSTLLNPEEPQHKSTVTFEKQGPLKVSEKSGVGVYAFYDRLPQALKDHKIGRVELLAFETR